MSQNKNYSDFGERWPLFQNSGTEGLKAAIKSAGENVHPEKDNKKDFENAQVADVGEKKLEDTHENSKAALELLMARENVKKLTQRQLKKLKSEIENISKTDQDTALETSEIKAIERAVDRNTIDEAAQDYEGTDETSEARKIIVEAYETHSQNLTFQQKEDLLIKIKSILKIAHDDEKHDIFNDVNERTSFGKAVTKGEATKIAEFIKTETGKMKTATPAEQTAATPAETKTQKLDKKIAAAEEKLSNFAKAKFAEGEPNQAQLLAVEKGGKEEIEEANKKIDAIAANFELDADKFKIAFKKLVALDIGLTGADWFGKQENKDKFKNNFSAFEKYFGEIKDQPQRETQLNKFFLKKGIENWKEKPDDLVRYLAFNEVEKDIATFKEWNEARNEKARQLKANEKLPEVKVAKQKVVDIQVEAGKAGAKETDEAWQKANELFKTGKIWDGIVVLFMVYIGKFFGEKFGEFFGQKKEEEPAAGSENPGEKSDPISKFLGIEKKDEKKLEALKEIKVGEFIDKKPEELTKFAKEKGLDNAKLTELQKKLQEKNKAVAFKDDEKGKTVLEFLQTKIKADEKYLEK